MNEARNETDRVRRVYARQVETTGPTPYAADVYCWTQNEDGALGWVDGVLANAAERVVLFAPWARQVFN